MKATTGIKWGLVFGVIIGLVVGSLIYAILYAPNMPSLQKFIYNKTLSETNNITAAQLAEKELPTILPVTIISIAGLSYAIGGAVGGLIISYIWEKNNSWIMKGIVGGLGVLAVSILLSDLPLIIGIPTSLVIGMLISLRLHTINRKI